MSDSWVPIDKAFRLVLAKKSKIGKEFTETEAGVWLQLDANDNKTVSVAGYAKLWRWGVKRVRLFLEKMGVTIIYPVDTKSKQNQRGYLKKVENLGTDQGTDKEQIKEQISFIDINKLKELRNRSGNRYRNRSGAATGNPIILNPKKKENTLSSEGSTADVPLLVTEIVGYLNQVTGKHFTTTCKDTRKHINARWADGYRLDDFKRVIEVKATQWLNDPKRNKYLRPETLFSPKFESYLNENNNIKPDEDPDERAARENTAKLIKQMKGKLNENNE